MLTWLTTFAGVKAVGFLRSNLLYIILIGAVTTMGGLAWYHYNGIVKQNEEQKKQLILREQEIERAREANRISQGIIKDLAESTKLNNNTVSAVRADLQKQAKLLEEMKLELRGMKATALTPPLKLGVTRMQQLLDEAQKDLADKPVEVPKPTVKAEEVVKKPLTDLKPQGQKP